MTGRYQSTQNEAIDTVDTVVVFGYEIFIKYQLHNLYHLVGELLHESNESYRICLSFLRKDNFFNLI